MASSISNRVKNILVLGAGLTGASIAASIKYNGFNVDIWEKSKGIGKHRLCFIVDQDGHLTDSLRCVCIRMSADKLVSNFEAEENDRLVKS